MEESTLLKRLLILKCIGSPQSKDVGKIDFFFCMERNARVDTPKSIATPERDFNMKPCLFLFSCKFKDICCHLLFKVPSDFFSIPNIYFIM